MWSSEPHNANVIRCDKDSSGIKSLHLDNNNTIEADLFIDFAQVLEALIRRIPRGTFHSI